MSGGRSRSCSMSQSSSRRHSSSTGPSRNACSSAESGCGWKSSSFCQCGHAAEQIGVPPDGAGFERDALGFAEARQHFREHRHHEARNEMAAQRRHSEQRGEHDQRDHAGFEEAGRRPRTRQPISQHAGSGSQARKPRPRNARTRKTSRARMRASSTAFFGSQDVDRLSGTAKQAPRKCGKHSSECCAKSRRHIVNPRFTRAARDSRGTCGARAPPDSRMRRVELVEWNAGSVFGGFSAASGCSSVVRRAISGAATAMELDMAVA